jgi:hypothetical protein
MKTKALFVVIVVFMLLMSCGSKPASKSNADQLDLAVREASDYLNGNLTKGSKLAILNIQSEFPALSEYIIDELIANTVNDKVFSIVDRQQLDTIRAEQNFQMSGEVDDNSAQKLGAMLGAQTIITGGVTKVGEMYRLRIRALSVESAQIEGQFNKNISNSSTVEMLVKSTASGGSAQVASAQSRPAAGVQTQAATSAAVPAAPAVQAYRVGETGPAGGIIFYDKRNNSGGWRYLEAAPVEAEFQALWSVHNTIVDNTQAAIGSGKRNTQIIVEKFSQTAGEWDTAAQKCDDLVFGGFDDWFLPSQAELDQMYGNLKRRNLGDFKTDMYYWSSTQNQNANWNANSQSFENGNMSNGSKNSYRNNVRPIRQVPGPNN